MDAATSKEMIGGIRRIHPVHHPERQLQGRRRLQPTTTATTVRVRDGKTLTTDGPFAETREQLGGYYLVEAKDLDAALAIAARIPGAKTARSRSGRSWSMIDEPLGARRLPVGSVERHRPERDASSNRKIFRDEAGRALATLIRLVGDFDLAEERCRMPSRRRWSGGRATACRPIRAPGWSMSAATRRSTACAATSRFAASSTN